MKWVILHFSLVHYPLLLLNGWLSQIRQFLSIFPYKIPHLQLSSSSSVYIYPVPSGDAVEGTAIQATAQAIARTDQWLSSRLVIIITTDMVMAMALTGIIIRLYPFPSVAKR